MFVPSVKETKNDRIYCEKTAKETGIYIDKGYELMSHFLND